MRTRVPFLAFVVLASAPSCTASDLDRLSARYGMTGDAGAGGDALGAGGAAGVGGTSGAAGKGGAVGTGGASGTAGAAGGKAGSAGASGASAGTGGAASTCDSPTASCTGCQLCTSAAGGPCVAETTACTKNPECGALQDCQNTCMDAACATKCDEQHPTGVMAYTAFNGCWMKQCKQACSLKLVCSGMPKTLTSTCFAGQLCNAITNVGCSVAAGEACDFDGTKFKCFGPPPANDIPLCGACDVDLCVAGTTCRPTSPMGTEPKCAAFCCVDADCGPQGKCSMGGGLPGGICVAQ